MAAPSNAQLSPYSSLADALTPWVKPFYELPQDAYHPDARITSSAGIAPIFFPLYKHYITTPYVTLSALLGDLQVLKAIMASGSDLVFEEREGTVKLDLRVMWPGYNAETMSMWLNPPTTTRALLAKTVGEHIYSYMDFVSRNKSALNKYQIGPNGIQTYQVLLRGIEHIDGDRWKAMIFIDNSMNV